MITKDDIETYDEDDMLWVDATSEVVVTAERAWDAIEPLISRLTELGTIGKTDVEVRKRDPDGPLIAEGNEVVAVASALSGVIKMPMSMSVTKCEPGRYARLAITIFRKQHFADVDFKIDRIDDERTRLRYRQGFRYHESAFGWLAKHVSLNPREIPETVDLFNLWVDTANSASLGDSNGSKE